MGLALFGLNNMPIEENWTREGCIISNLIHEFEGMQSVWASCDQSPWDLFLQRGGTSADMGWYTKAWLKPNMQNPEHVHLYIKWIRLKVTWDCIKNMTWNARGTNFKRDCLKYIQTQLPSFIHHLNWNQVLIMYMAMNIPNFPRITQMSVLILCKKRLSLVIMWILVMDVSWKVWKYWLQFWVSLVILIWTSIHKLLIGLQMLWFVEWIIKHGIMCWWVW